MMAYGLQRATQVELGGAAICFRFHNTNTHNTALTEKNIFNTQLRLRGIIKAVHIKHCITLFKPAL